ncbi:hypothetical protein B0H34DRAFT_80651 [Crassisporium funariophilum]|nr:hypothetical protein B0H34DRAFT_80651 [Crassisporium funariophilum]
MSCESGLLPSFREQHCSILDLPQELISKIIDDLDRDDHATLKSCAVVSRAFLHRSQELLFTKIELSPRAHLQVETLATLLMGRSSHLGLYIQEAHVILLRGANGDYHDALNRVLSSLHRLRVLSVDGGSGPTLQWPAAFSSPLRVTLESILQSIHLENLTLCFWTGVDTNNLRLHPSLQHLGLHNIMFHQIPQILSEHEWEPPCLQSLSLDSMNDRSIAAFLEGCYINPRAMANISALTYLHIPLPRNRAALKAISEVFLRCSPTLVNLTIDFTKGLDTDFQRKLELNVGNLSLFCLSELRTLEFSESSKFDSPAVSSGSPSILSTLPPLSKLDTIIIRVGLSGSEYWAAEWDEFDSTLLTLRPPLLRAIFIGPILSTKPMIRRRIMELLPNLPTFLPLTRSIGIEINYTS